jgi:hypothetical protein
VTAGAVSLKLELEHPTENMAERLVWCRRVPL